MCLRMYALKRARWSNDLHVSGELRHASFGPHAPYVRPRDAGAEPALAWAPKFDASFFWRRSVPHWQSELKTARSQLTGSFALLPGKPMCAMCRKYYCPLSSIKKHFGDREVFISDYDDLYKVPVDTPIHSSQSEEHKDRQGHNESALHPIGLPDRKSVV